MELPESILLCLFPNGVVLSQKQQQRQQQRQFNEQNPNDLASDGEEHEVYYVDVSQQPTRPKLELILFASFCPVCLTS